ncbi:MAG: hypothetical protein B7X78_03850, partial [Sphingomonadales bacterium 39-62-4]
MKTNSLLSAAALAVAFAAPAVAQQAAPLSPQDLVTLSRLGGSAISSDGKLVAYVVTTTDPVSYKRTPALWARSADGKDAPRRIDTGGSVSDPAFGPDGALYYLSDRKVGEAETTQVWKVDPASGVTTQATDSATFNVTVRAANAAPQLAPVGDQQAREGEELAFTVRGADTDADRLTYRMSGAPEGAVLDPATGAFRWTPAGNQSGTYSVTFTASDGHSVSAETVTLTVANANQAPIIVPIGLQLVREGSDLVFRASASDPDGDPVQLAVLSGLPQGALFVPSSGEFQWTPGFDQQGDHVLLLRAVDPSGASTDVSVVIRVADINREPV